MKTYFCPDCGRTLLLVESDQGIVEQWKNSPRMPRMRVMRNFEVAEYNLERLVEVIQNERAGKSFPGDELLFALQDWFLCKQAVDHQ